MRFRLYPLRFSFRAREPLSLSANLLRGALGMLLGGVEYERVFAPVGPDLHSAPSGLADRPRPFVIRAAELEVAGGQAFHVDLPYFDVRHPQIGAIARAFAQWRRAELTGVSGDSILTLPLDPPAEKIERVTVRFLTPTELKVEGGLAARPEFEILASRLRDRISTLRALYDEGPLELDFRAFAARAARVRMTRCELQHVETQRRSSRTGQTHSLGGFTGEADYQGDMGEFVPFLEVAHWTGVGRQTVWGKGALALHR